MRIVISSFHLGIGLFYAYTFHLELGKGGSTSLLGDTEGKNLMSSRVRGLGLTSPCGFWGRPIRYLEVHG